MLKIAVTGSSGRMGRMLTDAVQASSDCELAAALDQHATTAELHAGLQRADVLIDFTSPAGTMAHLAVCRELGVRAVIGTTGFSPEQKAEIAAHALHVATVLSANMSVGINVMLRLLDQATRALGPDYDVEVIEAHHKHKVDAPSGTALALGEAVAKARGGDLSAQGVFTRHGHTGARAGGAIGFAAVRGGDIVGEHTVLFAGTGERIEIAHKSSSRANYADGSLRAARFLAGLPPGQPGLYAMADVLGLG